MTKEKSSMARILCVDDNVSVLEMLALVVTRCGHHVVTCSSVSEAREKLATGGVDAVLSDWKLTDGSGQDVVKAAKASGDVPVAIISGYTHDAFQAVEPLADFFLEKPFSSEELFSLVKDLLLLREKKSVG